MAGPRRFRTIAFLALASALGAPDGTAAQAPEPISVRVRQVAGESVYLDIGTRHGLLTGDTIRAELMDPAAAAADLSVVAASEERSVLSFVSAPFVVTAGETLRLFLRRPPVAPVPAVAAPREDRAPPQPPTLPTSADRNAPSAGTWSGRVTADVTGLRSTTIVGGADPIGITRTFATPGLRLELSAPRIVSGFDFNTTARVSYRYSDRGIMDPAMTTQVYEASLARTFESVPLRLEIGRFRNTSETYSGYWDGLSVRYGGTTLGVSALFGFQPDRWNGAPSTDRPKATVVLDATRGGDQWWWEADISAHLVSGGDSMPDHRFLGFSQRIGTRRLRVNQDLQIDEDPTGGVVVSRLRVQGSLEMGAGWRALTGFTRRERYGEQRTQSEELFAPRSDRIMGGLTYRGEGTAFGLEASRSIPEEGSASQGYRAYADRTTLGAFGLGGSLHASYWRGDFGSSLSVSPRLTRSWGRAYWTLGYGVVRNDYLSRTSTEHQVAISSDLPWGTNTHVYFQLRAGFGSTLRSQDLRIQISRRF